MSPDHEWTEPDLDFLIDSAIDDFRIASRKWDDPDRGKSINDLADRLAAFLHVSAEAIAVDRDAELLRGVPTSLAASETLPIYPQVVEALQLRLAAKYIGSTREMAERCFDLLRLAFDGSPKDQVRRFLSRIARCYILDLAPEGVVFCRAALENALGEKYHSTSTSWPINEKGESPGPLRIQRALELEWLSEDLAKAAREIWTRGSKSAHQDPGVVTQLKDSITSTAAILAMLYK